MHAIINYMKKVNYQKYFENKKITVMGIGLLGRNIGDIKFLAKNGAEIIATDIKSKEKLKKSLRELKKFKNIKYTLDRHLVADFKNRDFILKGNGVSLGNKYIETAKNNNVPSYKSLALALNIFRKEDHLKIYQFLSENILKLDDFWAEYYDIFEPLQ